MSVDVIAAQAARDAVRCDHWADLYDARARRLIGRFAAAYLDDAQATPIELLHDYGAALRLFQAKDTLNDILATAARAQARAGGPAAADRFRMLAAMVNQILLHTRDLAASLSAEAMTTAGLNELAAKSAEPAQALAWAARDLAQLPAWPDKLARVLDLFAGDPSPAATAILDQVLAEFLERAGVQKLILRGVRDWPGRVAVLAAWLGLAPPRPADLPTGVGEILARPDLPHCRRALASWIERELSAGDGDSARPVGAHMKILQGVHDLFARQEPTELGARCRALVEMRMARLLTHDAPEGGEGGTLSVAARINAILDLLDRFSSTEARDVLLTFMRYVVGHLDASKAIPADGPAPAAVLARFEALAQRLGSSIHLGARRAAYLETLQTVIRRLRAETERRAGPRAAARANDYVFLDGVRVPLRNWSATGLLFGPIAGEVKPGQVFRLGVHVGIQRGNLLFDAEARVQRFENRMAGASYRCINAADETKIRAHFARLARAAKT